MNKNNPFDKFLLVTDQGEIVEGAPSLRTALNRTKRFPPSEGELAVYEAVQQTTTTRSLVPFKAPKKRKKVKK